MIPTRECVAEAESAAKELACEVEDMCEPGPGRPRQRSLMRRSSKSEHVGMMASRESDQTTRTRSSRCFGNDFFLSWSGLLFFDFKWSGVDLR